MSIVIIFNQKDPKYWEAKLKERLPDTDIYIYPNVPDKEKITFALCWKPSKNVLSQFPNLIAAQSVGAGVNHILNTQEVASKIQVSRIVDERLSNDMFEFALATILVQMKNLNQYHNDKRNQGWNRKDYQIIRNTTIGILGLGQVGAHVAEGLHRLGFEVLGWSKSKKQIDGIQSFVEKEGLVKLLSRVDYLVNILPLTDQTRNLINYDLMKLVKPGAYLINIGRGQSLVEADLVQIIKEGHLSGAALDVFQNEPLEENHPFWNIENIMITPHIASITNIESASELVVENYRRQIVGERLLFVV